MLVNIQDVLNVADERIIARGQEYHEDGMVVEWHHSSATTIEASVQGSEDDPYTVEIKTDGHGRITDCFCDCPYDYGDICKHIVAVLLALEDSEAEDGSQSASATSRPSARQVLEKLTEAQMRDFLRQQIASDKQLAKALCDHFVEPDAAQELAYVRSAMRKLRQEADHAWGNWHLTQQLYDKLEEQAARAHLRLSQGHCLLAARIALEVLHTGFDMIEAIDDGSDFHIVINDMVDVLCEAADDNAADYSPMLKLLETAVERCAEWVHEDAVEQLLEAIPRLLPEDGRKHLHSLIRKMEQDRLGVSPDRMQRLEARIIERFDGTEAADAYRLSHLENDSFCTMAIEQAMGMHQFQHAAEYCRMRLDASEYKHQKLHWLQLLLRVYQEAHDAEGQLQTLSELTLIQPSAYFESLRQLHIQRGDWQTVWPSLREQLKTEVPPQEYMSILHKEQQWPLLMEEVSRRPEQITAYGSALIHYDQQRTIALYEAMILQRARSATQRSMYAHVCDGIRSLYKAGGGDKALELIARLQNEHKRKPAFQDELNRLLAQIQR